jgi:eukaryotic-like serine/threonine-protein kinase
MREIRVIDRGGFGVVHEVEMPDWDRVARKSFDPQVRNSEEREKLQKRFAREVRIQSQIHHPNIMPILDHDLDASPAWFTMPLASKSFETKLEEDRRERVIDTKAWQDILAAVEELHRLGYVHRDLKPANILRLDERWVLSDFGLILPTARDTTILTSSLSAYGSSYYMAPEQAHDFRSTPNEADIYALGCILHDNVDPGGRRVPCAQIRIGGRYGPILERCTEINPKKRFPTIASLRASLFDLWRTSEFPVPDPDDNMLLEAVLDNPDSTEAWRALVGHIEKSDTEVKDSLLRAINAELIIHLKGVDDVLFGRMVYLLCEWASETGFAWSYCDVVGDRLLEAYRIATVRLQCEIVPAAIELAVSHNRWHVMNQVGAMLGPAADNGLVDRILIEMNLNPEIEGQLRRIERIVKWNRNKWHSKIASFLTEHEGIPF